MEAENAKIKNTQLKELIFGEQAQDDFLLFDDDVDSFPKKTDFFSTNAQTDSPVLPKSNLSKIDPFSLQKFKEKENKYFFPEIIHSIVIDPNQEIPNVNEIRKVFPILSNKEREEKRTKEEEIWSSIKVQLTREFKKKRKEAVKRRKKLPE